MLSKVYEVDNNANGTFDRVESTTYTDDAAGNLLSEVWRSCGEDRTLAYVKSTIYSYDESGNLLSKVYEVDGNWIESHTWDATGNLLFHITRDDQNHDRFIDFVVTITRIYLPNNP